MILGLIFSDKWDFKNSRSVNVLGRLLKVFCGFLADSSKVLVGFVWQDRVKCFWRRNCNPKHRVHVPHSIVGWWSRTRRSSDANQLRSETVRMKNCGSVPVGSCTGHEQTDLPHWTTGLQSQVDTTHPFILAVDSWRLYLPRLPYLWSS